MSLSSIFSKPVLVVLGGLAVMAYLDQILGFIARQADRVIATSGHYSGRIAIAAGLIGLGVHLFMPHAQHGWKIVERAALLVFGAALIPVLFPIFQTLGAGPVPHLVNVLFSALATGLAGIGG